MRAKLLPLRHTLLDWLYPPVCELCSAPAQQTMALCKRCLGDLRQNLHACAVCANPLPDAAAQRLVCGSCLKTPPFFDSVYAPYLYHPPADKLIIALKFRNRLLVAGLLAALMSKNLDGANKPDCLLPVPLHRKRLRERGYNQAGELARALAKRFAIPVVRAAVRVRHTPAQSSLSLAQRERNVQGAFQLRHSFLENYRHIAIIDDVVTTGSTVNELARILRLAGMEKIQIWSFARTSSL